MRKQLSDTSPEAERVLVELLRRAPAWRKLRLVEDTNRSVRDLLLAGLRERFPQDPPTLLRRRLADLWLGPELAAAAYGLLPAADKLQWYRDGGGVSDRQWNDVLGVLKVQGPVLDRAYLEEWALELGLAGLLREALDDAGLHRTRDTGKQGE